MCLSVSLSVRLSHSGIVPDLSGVDLSRVGVRVSQVKPLNNCFRRLEKLLLPSVFDSLSSFMMWNLQSFPTTVFNERMWQFRGNESKHTLTFILVSEITYTVSSGTLNSTIPYLWPSYTYFHGGRDPLNYSMIYATLNACAMCAYQQTFYHGRPI